jgi:hypothetical protein
MARKPEQDLESSSEEESDSEEEMPVAMTPLQVRSRGSPLHSGLSQKAF